MTGSSFSIGIVLGTAQLGMAYGIANSSGRPDRKRVRAVVRSAWESGIRYFDTARAYGDSESVLGQALRELGIAGEARVITKLPPDAVPEDYAGMAEESLRRLGVPQLESLMLHREEALERWDDDVETALSGIVQSGAARSAGISVYSPEAALRAVEKTELQVVQFPSNILDRRFERTGLREKAAAGGVNLHVRSVFLQGLFFRDPKTLPAGLAHAAPWLQALKGKAESLSLCIRDLCLAYVREAWPGAMAVIGAEEAAQVAANAAGWRTVLPPGEVARCAALFHGVEDSLLDPSQWETSDD